MILDECQKFIKIKKIDIVVLDMPLLNTTKYKNMNGLENLISDIILQLLSYMAEDERIRIEERQKEGIMIAKNNGVKFDRKKYFQVRISNQFILNGKITPVKAMEFVNMKSNLFIGV